MGGRECGGREREGEGLEKVRGRQTVERKRKGDHSKRMIERKR